MSILGHNKPTWRRASRLGNGAQRRLRDRRPLPCILAPPDKALLPPELVLFLLVLFNARLGHARRHTGRTAGDCAFRAGGRRQDVELACVGVDALDAEKVAAGFEVLAPAMDLSLLPKGLVVFGGEALVPMVATTSITGHKRCNRGL
ncbi:uncharacterized protein SPSK_04638 [Sporothrix schenckii 1099-18]|uniref:Uncharacterized protein n=1 Tax=Sporothrix schenckii 1099-18 TaxID=1397361 RepID=A0A0F2M165_SPOSC|nr:uncharacterized protein SPSK_04638 [Sporothrix schenckii 1099-18]KJR83432.1 hypothetical protein SPSK_04638 [Sporothrix schenckii 1099-18]